MPPKLSYVRKLLCALGLLVAGPCFPINGFREEPVKVTPCELANEPAAYNHKLVEVAGFISHGFEDFRIYDPACSSRSPVWLEYGGLIASGTIYCCGHSADRSRPKQLVVENIPIPLLNDERFREFDRLVQRSPDSVVHATVVGRFFSGSQLQYPGGLSWAGYGHMGCCTLLAIEQILSVDPQTRRDLDYRASADQPSIDKVGCSYRNLLQMQSSNNLIDAQLKAELGQREWSFDNPRRVAVDALGEFLGKDEKSASGLEQTGEAQGRFVYEWREPNQKTYMIVVSRPYWLTFYAKDARKVAWVVIAAYESWC